MSAPGFTPIQLYYSTTASAAPSSGNLANGELAINITDGKLYYKDNGGTVRVLAGTGGTGVVAGSNTQVQFNNNGVFGASSGLTFDGTTLTANALTVSNAVTLSGGTANGVAYLNGSQVLTSGSALQFDGSNLGLGVTPSAWDSTFVAAQLGAATATNGNAALYSQKNGGFSSGLLTNTYYSGGWKYVTSNPATRYEQNTGSSAYFAWYIAPSGTAGNAISFTQAMTLDASGNLGVGTTSPFRRLEVVNTSGIAAQVGIKAANTGYSELYFADTDSNTVGAFSYDHNTNALATYVNGTERARIDSSGNLLVGATSSSGIFTGSSVNTGTAIERTGSIGKQRNDDACAYWSKAAGYTSGTLHSFYVNGSNVGSITTNGTVTGFNTISDYRLKNITGPVTGAREFIMALQPKQGTWKADGSKFVGFLAHEFQEVSPSSVTGEKDAVDADGNPVYQSMQASSSEVMANLIALVQEQQAIIDSIKARLDAANL